MNGAARHDPPPLVGAPPADVVHRIHDRYLVEIVEGLGLCPFARKSREQGRVHRPLWFCEGVHPQPGVVAEALVALAERFPDAEIVLLTFVGGDAWVPSTRAHEDFVAALRDAYGALDGPLFYMVGFHPEIGGPPTGQATGRPAGAVTRDSLVPLLRRSPDPVIQCVRAEVLERVRAQAQRAAHERMLVELEAIDPAIAAIARDSVQPDSELSADIARHNFAAVGSGPGRDELERRLAAIAEDRARSYGMLRGDVDAR